MTTPPPSLGRYWQQLRKPLELEVAHGCPDTAIVGASIGIYSRLWASRLQGGSEEDERLALSIARGLRDYATMPVVERRRRAMAAIDLLRQREANATPTLPAPRPAPRPPATERRPAPKKKTSPVLPLPVGQELMEMPLSQLAPRARWPQTLADHRGIYTVRDLLYHIPRDWIDITHVADAQDGARVAIVGTVSRHEYDRLKSKQIPQALYKYTLSVDDGTGTAWVTSITITPPSGSRNGKNTWSPARLQFSVGQRVFALGKVERTGKLVEIKMEDIFQVTEAETASLQPGAQVPLYPLTAGVYQNQVHRMVLRILAALDTEEGTQVLPDPLPAAIREQYGLLPLVETLRELHAPQSPLRHEMARKRLAFEEFLVPQLLMAKRRWEHHHREEAPVFHATEHLPSLISQLVHFEPTLAQLRVIGEIEDDLRHPHPMNRLLQGDVGSGKTLVAAGALAFAVRSGFQAAIMAPTEILAEQLALVISRLLKPLAIDVVLLTGSQSTAERREARERLATGTAHIAVGTHALIQEGVEFDKLGLVVIDEQHRFGVLQRVTLRSKGRTPNMLVMTATPIPRTLSLTAYGDLDVSVLDELPPGRHPIETRWMSNTELHHAYEFLRAQIAEGHQAYVLCPLVEQSEMLQADAAVEMAAELQKRVFPDLKVGLLHGRMKPDEKDAAMEAFRTGATHILACTTVIEVGVDVPNATVILIHNAERFGLAQLHQLRGRVGRSEHQSTCLLITNPRFSPLVDMDDDVAARKRLRIMLDQQDGFAIAEADLEIRGPGEYFGTRQSGVFDFTIGNLLRDGKYLEQARKAAQEIVEGDHDLTAPDLADLRRRVIQMKARLDQFSE
ncbi:MAG: ATP-dependent DNA helicase RecG [Armatimonadota bacterium]